MCCLPWISSDDGSVPRNAAPRTVSGGEPSSTKRNAACAAGLLFLSRLSGSRTYRALQRPVCGPAPRRAFLSR